MIKLNSFWKISISKGMYRKNFSYLQSWTNVIELKDPRSKLSRKYTSGRYTSLHIAGKVFTLCLPVSTLVGERRGKDVNSPGVPLILSNYNQNNRNGAKVQITHLKNTRGFELTPTYVNPTG